MIAAKKTPVACDIDGVLADFDECWRRAMYDAIGVDRRGIACAPTWDLMEAYDITKEQHDAVWQSPFLRLHMAVAPVLPRAKEIAAILPEGSFYITARGSDLTKPHAIEFRKLTIEWLAMHDFPDHPVIFSDHKVEFCQRHGILQAVDDAPHHIEAYVDAGIQTFIPVTEYNCHLRPGLEKAVGRRVVFIGGNQ